MLLLVFVALHIITGMLAYGISKGECLTMYEYYQNRGELEEEDKHVFVDEMICIMFAFWGPLGFIMSFLCHFAFQLPGESRGFRLCFKMPKEFCAGQSPPAHKDSASEGGEKK